MNIEDLLAKIEEYEQPYRDLILRAYLFAKNKHAGVKRKSGEPYIIHPVAVACTLADMHADADTIAAGLLHDTIEDCDDVTYETIAQEFNPTIANLVNGVTKIKKTEVADPNLAEEANMRKIIESLTEDVRIFVIKLADRLHNMRTMEYQSPSKQISKSRETMNLYVPFATLIGAYTLRLEMEDLSFKYLNPDQYKRTLEIKNEMEKQERDNLDNILTEVAMKLNSEGIKCKIFPKYKNIYGLYKRLRLYDELENVHDAITIRILVDDIDSCYKVREMLKGMFDSLPERDKDYIATPKANMYRGLHTTLKAVDGTMIQVQIKTKEMYAINSYGITAVWDLFRTNLAINSAMEMQSKVSQLEFYRVLKGIVESNLSTLEFNQAVREDIIQDKLITVFVNGRAVEIPEGSTAVDLAYKLGTDLGNYLVSAKINKVSVPLNCIVNEGDEIELFSDRNMVDVSRDLSSSCYTKHARKKIKEFKKNNI